MKHKAKFHKGISASEELAHVNVNEYAFFVSSMSPNDYDRSTGLQNNYNNWLKGIADEKVCRVISVDAFGIEKFISHSRNIYNYCECVYSPDNGLDIEEINLKINQGIKSEKSELEKQKEKTEQLERELLELKQLLTNKTEVKEEKTEKRKRRTKEEIEKDKLK